MASTAPTTAPPKLTDDAILDYIFNPGLQGVPMEPVSQSSESQIEVADEKTLIALRALESEAVKCAEADDFVGASALLHQALKQCPAYASAHNNLAQVFLLQGKLPQALDAVGECIRLGNAQHNNKVLAKAHAQRGIIYKRLGKHDEALVEFQAGARYGDLFAKKQAVQLNPYAAMCNAMMEKVLDQEKKTS